MDRHQQKGTELRTWLFLKVPGLGPSALRLYKPHSSKGKWVAKCISSYVYVSLYYKVDGTALVEGNYVEQHEKQQLPFETSPYSIHNSLSSH